MITKEQEKAFQENGHVILEHQLSDPWIHALRAASDWWMRLGVLLDRDKIPLADHGMVRLGEGEYIFSVIDLHRMGRVESLELLGSPMILEPVMRLCGEDAVPVIETLEVRRPEDKLDMYWNQRRLHRPADNSIVVSVALDSIVEQRGALQFAPHTQQQKQDICAIQRKHGFDPKGLIVPTLRPGDILIYDTMLACCSPVVIEGPLVRTLDLEFCSESHAVNSERRSSQWLEQKRDLMEYAKDIYNRLHDGITDEESFATNEVRAEIFRQEVDRIASYYAIKTQVEPSHFCIEFKPGDRIGTPTRMPIL